MLTTLAFRHLLLRKRRALFLLLGYALGVGVMIVLLSVGEAMLEQSRDVSLVGGGSITVLPQGIDIEAMRTGGLSGMFFGIDRARFIGRQLLGGPRTRDVVRAISPEITRKLVYLSFRGRTLAVRSSGELPGQTAAVGAAPRVLEGAWIPAPGDSDYLTPSPESLYHELDHFHLAQSPDTTWGEWHYFNLVISPREWWYVSFLVGGQVPDGRWSGQVLATHRMPDGRYERFQQPASSGRSAIDTLRADLRIGAGSVRQAGGVYHVETGSLGPRGARLDFTLTPSPHRYIPALSLSQGELPSGYVVPALRGTATGTICLRGRCRKMDRVAAYHDHNWGVWRDVTWDWGAARGSTFDLLYGRVQTPGRAGSRQSGAVFVALVDSLGFRQVFRSPEIRLTGRLPALGAPGAVAPSQLELRAVRDADTLRLRVETFDALSTEMGAGGFRRYFLQMRGRFRLEGTVAGTAVADSGVGFFETYFRRQDSPARP